MWDFESGRIVKSFKPDDGGEGDGLFLTFGTVADRLITSASDGIIRVIDVNSGRTLLTGRGPKDDIRAPSLRDDRLTLMSGGYWIVGEKVAPQISHFENQARPPAQPLI